MNIYNWQKQINIINQTKIRSLNHSYKAAETFISLGGGIYYLHKLVNGDIIFYNDQLGIHSSVKQVN